MLLLLEGGSYQKNKASVGVRIKAQHFEVPEVRIPVICQSARDLPIFMMRGLILFCLHKLNSLSIQCEQTPLWSGSEQVALERR